MILQMTFKTTAIIPFIKVSIERPDIGIRRIDMAQNTQKNCPQIRMIKGTRLAEYTGSKIRSRISGNAKQKIKMGRESSCNHRVTVFKRRFSFVKFSTATNSAIIGLNIDVSAVIGIPPIIARAEAIRFW